MLLINKMKKYNNPIIIFFLGIILCGDAFGQNQSKQTLPVVPVGYDAYLMWDRLAYQRIGVRAYMRSTFDRSGGNHGGDASHFLYQTADTFNVTLDVNGSGILYFARYNHWHGSPWHYEVDGKDNIVQESSSQDPTNPVKGSIFLPEHLFPKPLCWTWSDTKGADLMWAPVMFEESFRMAYTRTRYGTGYYIYHQFLPGIKLSQPIISWNKKNEPDKNVLKLISRSGTDIAPRANSVEGNKIGIKEIVKQINIPVKNAVSLLNVTNEAGMIGALEFSVPKKSSIDFGKARIRVTWDNMKHPSIDAPLNLFFGAGTFYNRDGKEYLVKSFPMNVKFTDDEMLLAFYFPMPFFKSAKFEIYGSPIAIENIGFKLRYAPYTDPKSHVAYFHATYKDHPYEHGQDLTLLDTRKTEGGGDWSGHMVGTSFIFSHNADLSTLEGDPRFFFDDSQTPQAQGTGTEEWGGGGDYWGGDNMSLPFAGHPTGAKNEDLAKNEEDKIESAYRFLIADLMPFGKNALIKLEHGPENLSREHYKTVVYWYGVPKPSLIKTDELNIGHIKSETQHNYIANNASSPYKISSRYEWGKDTIYIKPTGKPLAEPTDFIDLEFEADTGSYYIWVRGKDAEHELKKNFWIQFDDKIGTDRQNPEIKNHLGFGNWPQKFSHRFPWTSHDTNAPGVKISFNKPGKHRLRIQPRETNILIDQIWLSKSQHTIPGAQTKHDQHTFEDRGNKSEIIIDASNSVKRYGKIEVITEDSTNTKQIFLKSSYFVAFPEHTQTGRVIKDRSQFELKIDPENVGVMLRRTLDYSFPNQKAEVLIADANSDNWKSAGIWYLAGSNTVVYSNHPRGVEFELGPTLHTVETSNRRFKDDEFLIPASLTEGRSSIRVQIRFIPVNVPLFPGHPVAELGWSEIKYTAYSFVIPDLK